MILNYVIYHNPVQDWLISIGITVIFFLFVLLAKRIIYKKLVAFTAKTITTWDDLVAELIGRLHPLFFLVLAVPFGSARISLPKGVETILDHGIAIITLIQAAVLCTHAVSFWVNHYRKEKLA
jgi:hypothetical protein